ncbi:hypothetical protein [Marinigracilibium pacificum]|uniref:TerB family tellurite resistance protein n=1 Tax=Marinigracilibium pacificum TaxID=2729599 RepID=A0A848IVC6_9BACT|nr:hypothetical protein [Marinigracilibium pacificum]NMM48433.1 hypothetical protein [Marinigracilibium pacificum]
MIEAFKSLNPDEVKIMMEAPVWVTILIASADHKIDKEELDEALSMIHLREKTGRFVLREYYHEVDQTFKKDLEAAVASLPDDEQKAGEMVLSHLKKINDVLPKLDRKFAIQFYDAMQDFSMKVAKANGGFLGWFRINYDEKQVVDLPMINDPEKI